MMNKVISKEEALDTLVRLARMKDKEFDLNEMGNIDVIEKSYLILNQALDDVPTSTDIEEALEIIMTEDSEDRKLHCATEYNLIKQTLQSVDTKTLKVDETHLESSQHITSDEIVKDFLTENKDD